MQPQDVAQCVAMFANRDEGFDPIPVTVTIGRTTYCAAEYRTYHDPALYVVGEKPPSYKRSRNTMYFDGDCYWYVAFYSDVNTVAEHSSYWPLGPAFGMFKDPFQYLPHTRVVKMKINYTPSVAEGGVVGQPTGANS